MEQDNQYGSKGLAPEVPVKKSTSKVLGPHADRANVGISNSSLYLAARLERLQQTQNSDGGWSYYSGKQASWLEPTVFAALALHGQAEADRAWTLVRNWQLPSGGWRPTASVAGANWSSALALTLASVRGQSSVVEKGLEWLGNASTDGAWSWRRTNLSAAEPTALAILALRKAGAEVDSDAREFLLKVKLGPETCGPALVGLQGSQQLQAYFPQAVQWAEATASPLTRAWLHLGLRVNQVEVPEPVETPLPRNLSVLALEALAAREGNHRLLRAEVKA